jgi:hypothetical protein
MKDLTNFVITQQIAFLPPHPADPIAEESLHVGVAKAL